MSKSKFDLYEAVTERFVAALEEGTIPWRQPWVGQEPMNLISGRPYRGVNLLLLGMGASFERQLWLTMKQANELGAKVRKGERSTMVVFYKQIRVRAEEGQAADEEGKRSIWLLRYYRVFNVAQLEDGEAGKLAKLIAKREPEQQREHEPLALCDEWVEQYLADDGPSLGAGSPAYSPKLDRVLMPLPEMFESSAAYYSTFFHELAHSTGHEDRLNRDGIVSETASFGSPQYAREELVAEISAGMLCARAGIDNERQIENAKAYVQHWIDHLTRDPKLVVSAAARAQKAADLIAGVQVEQESEVVA
jgi:antirestriction protein ArdC